MINSLVPFTQYLPNLLAYLYAPSVSSGPGTAHHFGSDQVSVRSHVYTSEMLWDCRAAVLLQTLTADHIE